MLPRREVASRRGISLASFCYDAARASGSHLCRPFPSKSFALPFFFFFLRHDYSACHRTTSWFNQFLASDVPQRLRNSVTGPKVMPRSTSAAISVRLASYRDASPPLVPAFSLSTCGLQVTTSEDTLNPSEVSTPTLVWGSTESRGARATRLQGMLSATDNRQSQLPVV